MKYLPISPIFLFFIFQYRNSYFCTEIYISVLGNTLLYCCHIFLPIFFFIFCTATFIFVLRFIFLHWDKYCCTVVHIYCTEEYSRTTDEYVFSGTYVFVLRD